MNTHRCRFAFIRATIKIGLYSYILLIYLYKSNLLLTYRMSLVQKIIDTNNYSRFFFSTTVIFSFFFDQLRNTIIKDQINERYHIFPYFHRIVHYKYQYERLFFASRPEKTRSNLDLRRWTMISRITRHHSPVSYFQHFTLNSLFHSAKLSSIIKRLTRN